MEYGRLNFIIHLVVNTIRDTLKVIDIKGLKQINEYIIKGSIENKVFENRTIDGYTMVAIDGQNSLEVIRKVVQNA